MKPPPREILPELVTLALKDFDCPDVTVGEEGYTTHVVQQGEEVLIGVQFARTCIWVSPRNLTLFASTERH